MSKCWGLLRSCLFFLLIFSLGGCGSSSFDREFSGSSGNSHLSDDNSIIQSRVMEDGHLEIFALVPPALGGDGFQPTSLPQEARQTDFLSNRLDLGNVQAKNGTGNLYRLYTNWDLATDSGDGSYSNRAVLDGGEGLYVTDFGMEFTRSRTTLPSEDGTYYYVYNFSNTKGSAYSYEYVYTKSGEQATLTFGTEGTVSYTVYQGAPLPSASLGMGILISSFFGQAGEATQDSLYTGTWTITENMNGVTGETGQFDMRRLDIANFQIDPVEFNPSADETVEIRADVIALPLSTELTPNGWAPSGPIEWLVEIDDPLVPRSAIVSLTGSAQSTSPDENGKVGTLVQTWDGKDSSGEFLLNAQYIVRTQVLGVLESGNVITKETPAAIQLGNKAVRVKNLQVTPEAFNPEDGETVTVSFDIETVGFEDPNLHWEADVFLKEDDSLVHSFSPGDAMSKETESVTYEWDGFGATGPVNGELVFRVNVRACEGQVLARFADPTRQRVLYQTGDGVCALADEEGQGNAGAAPTLKVLLSVDSDPIASSQDNASNPSSAARSRLGRIHNLGEWVIEARNLEFTEGEEVTQVTVDLEGSASQNPHLTTLTKQTDGDGETVFRGTFNPDSHFILPFDQLPTDPVLSVAELSSPTLTGIFSKFVQRHFKDWLSLDEAEFKRANLGRFTFFNKTDVGEDEALGDLDNLKTSIGFESVQVEISKGGSDGNSRLSSQDLRAVVKVANPSSYFVYSGHGGRDSLVTCTDALIGPESLDTSTLEVFVLTSCHVLDFNNYNNYIPGPNEPEGEAPGKAWWDANVKGTDKLLLGYNAPPTTVSTSLGFRNYIGYLKSGDDHIKAWLKGNLDVEGYGLRACAWDKDNYYYLSYEEDFDPVSNQFKTKFKGAYAIPVAENPPANPSGAPPDEKYKLEL